MSAVFDHVVPYVSEHLQEFGSKEDTTVPVNPGKAVKLEIYVLMDLLSMKVPGMVRIIVMGSRI